MVNHWLNRLYNQHLLTGGWALPRWINGWLMANNGW